MYTVSKGPSKFVTKTTRRGISQNYDKLDSVRDISRRNGTTDNGEDFEQVSVPKPVFQSKKSGQYLRSQQYQQPAEEVLSPQHEELIKYIHESWNMVASNPYDAPASPDSSNGSVSSMSSNSSYTSMNSNASTSTYYVGTPSPLLQDFKPFDLEAWWGKRLFHTITKSL